MAEKEWDPTDPSDPSANPDSAQVHESDDSGSEPTGEELLRASDPASVADPDLGEGELAPIEQDELVAILGDDSLELDAERDEREPEPAALGSRRPTRKASTEAVAEPQAQRRNKKEAPTPKQRREADEEPRTTPPEFVKQSVGELRKVVWPTAEQVRGYFVVVLVFVLFIIAFVSVLDLVFGWTLLKVFS